MRPGHLGEALAERRVWDAVTAVLKEGRRLTPDLGGNACTTDLARAIVDVLHSFSIFGPWW